MSAQLVRLEKIASQKMITDPDQIASLTEHFLGRSLKSLVPPYTKGRTYMAILADDMAKGIGSTGEVISDCSVGEVLMMFSREGEFDFFEPPFENLNMFHLGIKVTAGHCFYLAGIFHNYKNSDIRMKALMIVQLKAFVRFLKSALMSGYVRGRLTKEDFEDRAKRVDIAMSRMMGFCLDRVGGDSDRVTLGHVLEKSFLEGTRAWSCHILELTKFAEGVVRSYDMANTLFMDCITNALVLTEPDRYKRGIELTEDTFEPDEDIFEADVKSTGKE